MIEWCKSNPGYALILGIFAIFALDNIFVAFANALAAWRKPDD